MMRTGKVIKFDDEPDDELDEPDEPVEAIEEEKIDAGIEPESEPESAPTLPEGASHFWNGLPVYKCSYCQFDTLDRAQRDKHMDQHFGGPAPGEPPLVVLYDRFGNEIKKQGNLE